MSKSALALAGLALILAVGGGLYLAGMFDAEEPSPVIPGLQSGVEEISTPEPDERPETGVTPSKIPTSQFTSANDRGGVSRTLAGPSSGIVVTGTVMDPDGNPLPKATVALIRDIGQLKTRAQEGETLLTLKTGSDGRYAFENLAPEEIYVLKASHDDYTTERRHPVDPRAPQSLRHDIKLQEGTALAGLVMDDAGAPLAGARVVVYDMAIVQLDPRADPERVAESLPDGTYRVPHLAKGLKRVLAEKPGYATDGRNGINLREDEEIGEVNFTLSGGHSIQGIVRDRRSGQPVPGALVTGRLVNMLAAQTATPNNPDRIAAGDGEEFDSARSDSGGQPQSNSPNLLRARANFAAQKTFLTVSAETDEAGRFVLEGLMEARYILAATCKGYQVNHATPADAGSQNVIIELSPSARIMGQVVDDDTGQPVTQFSVATSAQPTPMYITPRVRQSFESDQGLFTYVDVPPGKHYLIAEAHGYAGGRSEPVSVATEQEITGITIRVVRGATIKGSVVTHDGKPISGARVSLAQPVQGEPGAQAFINLIQGQVRGGGDKGTSSGPDGTWEIPNVLGGTYTAKVEHPNYSDAESPPFTCEDRGETALQPTVLTTGATIRVLVRKTDGTPDTQATVMVTSDDPINAGKPHPPRPTDPQGRVEVRGIKPGNYRVLVTQRNGEFDLLAILQSRQNPSSLVTVSEGQVLELER